MKTHAILLAALFIAGCGNPETRRVEDITLPDGTIVEQYTHNDGWGKKVDIYVVRGSTVESKNWSESRGKTSTHKSSASIQMEDEPK